MSTKNVLITGAASGIGLAFCQYYHSKAYHVIASVRKSSPELDALNVEVIEGVDLLSPDTITKLPESLGDRALDLLINCAGLLSNETLADLDIERIQMQWQINALGPLQVTHALLANLSSASKIAMITSRMGSIADNTSGSRYGYRMSKAALNAGAKSLAEDLRPKGIAVAILHPGLVSTKMIGFNGDVSPEIAAERLAARIDELTIENSGTFWHANGEVLPW